jgi:hypothetical protein
MNAGGHSLQSHGLWWLFKAFGQKVCAALGDVFGLVVAAAVACTLALAVLCMNA